MAPESVELQLARAISGTLPKKQRTAALAEQVLELCFLYWILCVLTFEGITIYIDASNDRNTTDLTYVASLGNIFLTRPDFLKI